VRSLWSGQWTRWLLAQGNGGSRGDEQGNGGKMVETTGSGAESPAIEGDFDLCV